MKIHLIPAFVIVLACSACTTQAAPPVPPIPEGSGTLNVSVITSADTTGTVYVALYDSGKHWLKKPAYAAQVPVRDGVAHATFTHITYGAYAASAFLDQNGNGKLDTGMFHIPEEPVGSSNNAKGFFGPPSFGDARFILQTPTMKIKFKLSD